MIKPPGSPACWSNEWEGDDAQCVGGVHPTHVNKDTGTNVFTPCGYEASCRQEFLRKNPQLISPTSLVRNNRPSYASVPTPNYAPAPTPAPAPAPTPTYYQPAAAPVQPYYPHYPHYQAPAAPAPAPAPQPPPVVHVQQPQQVPYHASMPTNFSMPHYLSQQQDVASDTFMGALSKTLLRSAVKAMGHSTAAFFDHTPIPVRKRE